MRNNMHCNNMSYNNMNCNTNTDYINSMPIGMAYVPWQHWNEIYDIEKGFHNGTIFPELNKPYMGRRYCR